MHTLRAYHQTYARREPTIETLEPRNQRLLAPAYREAAFTHMDTVKVNCDPGQTYDYTTLRTFWFGA